MKLIPFKGRLGYKQYQYMKNKCTKWGVKVFVLSDATNGYVYRLQIYTGKQLDTTVDTAWFMFKSCFRINEWIRI